MWLKLGHFRPKYLLSFREELDEREGDGGDTGGGSWMREDRALAFVVEKGITTNSPRLYSARASAGLPFSV